MHNILKTLVAILIISIVLALAITGITTIWSTSLFSWALFMRIWLSSLIGVAVLYLVWILMAMFLKRDKYDADKGNHAHPMN